VVDSAGHMVLAAIAGRTERIRLGTSVTVLSTQDPVRVYQNFATLHALSRGRAQLVVGRGSSVESFPLFGFDLSDYEQLFEEKLDLLTRLLRQRPVTWRGTVRPDLDEVDLTPAISPGAIPVWVGVGGSARSVQRAARYRWPLMIAIIGGSASRFLPLVDLYRKQLADDGAVPLPVGQHSGGLIADTDDEAVECYWPEYERLMDRMSKERGFSPPTRAHFEAEIEHGALFLGSPETVAAKMAKNIAALGLGRFDLKYDFGLLSRDDRSRTITLFGTEVVPRVRALLAGDGNF
jgi:alkanesulfonate monooxygenase SsuD/methylene tetrahydromethanopterin reductase-like flavin-dependent oxidoreductase (luciferase family)